MQVACHGCGIKLNTEDAAEFIGCDDGVLLLCQGCDEAVWTIPQLFSGSFGMLRLRAISLIQSRLDHPTPRSSAE